MGNNMSFSRRYSSIKFFSPRKYSSNPLFQKRRKKIRRVSLKIKLIIVAALIAISGVGWSLLFNRYFFIDNVVISGSQNIAENKVYDIIEQQLGKKSFFFFRQQNIFAFSKRQAKNEILKNYFVVNLKIHKKLPRTLEVSFSENTAAAVWAENDSYYYIDADLNILSPLDNLGLIGDAVVILKNISSEPLIKQEGLIKKVGIGEVYISACLGLTKKLADLALDIDSICEINKPEAEIRFNFKNQGPKLRFSAEKNIDKQLEKLKVLLQEKISKDKLPKLEYIDLRFGDKVYYK